MVDNNFIIQRIRSMYLEYGVNTAFLDTLDEEHIIKGMKGVLAELDVNKNRNYEPEDIKFIQEAYSLFC